MIKRISLFFCVFVILACLVTAGVMAQTYTPDNDGVYSVSFDAPDKGSYFMVVIKGEYDQTNFIEAYRDADDSDILYFEHKSSDEDGTVTFGPFVPAGYYDATVIVGGKALGEPVIAGYLSAEGISNSASVNVYGVEKEYLVDGVYGIDYTVNVQAEVLDSFGYPSVTNEEVSVSLKNAPKGVTLEDNVITIDRCASAGVFTVSVQAGDASKDVYVNIKRGIPSYQYMAVYTDSECTEEVEEITVRGVVSEKLDPVTIYVKTYDQYGDPIDDEYTFYYDGKIVDSTFVPSFGDNIFTAQSKNSPLSKGIMIYAVARPAYAGAADELFNLIETCNEKLSEDKNVSENGRDVFPDETWTTQNAVNAFTSAVETAKAALNLYGTDGYLDDDYSDEVTALTKALNTYTASFKAGIRKDITSISLSEQNVTVVEKSVFTLSAKAEPVDNNDVLTWTSSDDSIATVEAATKYTAKVTPLSAGKATITVTTRGGVTASMEVTVIKAATAFSLSATATTATYGSEPVVLKAQISPKGCTDIITWSVDKPELLDLVYNEYIDDNGFRCIEATVVPKGEGKAKITVSAQYGGRSASKEITVKMPAWETAEKPVSSVEAGSILPGTEIVLTTNTPGATIYYTLDGSVPKKETARVYNKPIIANQSFTINAMASGNEMFDSEISTYEYTVVNTMVEIGNTSARSGETANVEVVVSEFENVKNASIVVEYGMDNLDAAASVTLEEIEGITITSSSEDGKITINLSNDAGFTYSGKIATLSFDTRADIPEGDYAVTVTSVSVELADGTVYQAASADGSININNFLVGDVNDDGKIGLSDVLMLRQYLAGDESVSKVILLRAADTDADGDVDNDDAKLLSKYCVGWDVTLG